MKCSCFGTFAIACSSTTGFQYLNPSCSVLTSDSGSLRSWFGHERVIWGWGGPTRAKGLQSQVSVALTTGNTKSSNGANADKGTVNIREQHNTTAEKEKGRSTSKTWGGKIHELVQGFNVKLPSALGFNRLVANHNVLLCPRGNLQNQREVGKKTDDTTTFVSLHMLRIPCATKANTVPSAAAHGLQATEFGVHVEKPLNLTVVVGADTQLGGSIAKRLHASLKLTVNDLRSTQLLKNPTIASALQNVETLIFSPISSEREGWLSVFFPPFRREKNALQDQDVEIFLKMCGRKLSKVICLSSIGANRVGNMPFTLRNIGGDLNTKRAVEQAVIRGSQILGYTYTIVRTGTLQENNVTGVNMAYGDALEGKTTNALAEEAILQSLEQAFAGNTSFSIISTPMGSSSNSNSSSRPDQIDWDDLFLKLEPELLRISLADLTSLGNAATVSHYIQQWAQRWVKLGSGLTTPVMVSTPDEYTTQILFNPPVKDYISVKNEKRQAQDTMERGEELVSPLKKSSGLQGGVYIVVEPDYGRVRFVRSKRDPGVVLNGMSEQVLLERFKKDIVHAIKEERC